MSDKKDCKDLTHHLPLTRSVVSDLELKNLFNCDKELTSKDYELLINSKVHVDNIYEKKEVDAILNHHQNQLNNHENRITNLETNKTDGGGGSGGDHSHLNKEVLDIITYSGAKSEVDLYLIEDLKSKSDFHYIDEEVHASKSEKDDWNITSEKVISIQTDLSLMDGEIKLKASKTELNRVEAKIDGLSMGSGNLLRNSDFRSNLNLWDLENPTNVKLLNENNYNYCHIAQVEGRTHIGQLVESFEQGVNYTLSFLGYGEGELFLEIHQRGDGDNNPIVTNGFVLTATPTKYVFTFKSDTDVLENSFYITMGSRDGATCDLKFTKIKFERGDSAGEWTPNVSDVLLEVDELEQGLKDLSDYVNIAFKDGIITEAECKNLEERIESLEREKIDVKAQVDIILRNAILANTIEREQLVNSYSAFDVAHLELVEGIKSVISDKKITTAEKNQIKSLTTAYSEKLGGVRVAIQNATTKISELNSNNAYEKAEELIIKEVSDVNKSLNGLKNLTDNIFLDGLISLTEAQSLKVIVEDLEKEKYELISQVDELQIKKELNGTQELLKLGTAEEEFIFAHSDLLSCIAKISEDNKVTKEEKDTYNIKFDIYKQKLVGLSDAIQKALDKILEVKMAESLQNAKDYANAQIGELNKEISDLENLTNEAFKDGILTIAEKEALKLELKDIHKEQADVLAQVEALLNPHLSPELIGTNELRELTVAKDGFGDRYRTLTKTIESILAKTLIGAIDRENLASEITKYTTSLGVLREKIQMAISKIAEVKAIKETDKIKDNLVYKMEIFSTNGGVFKNGAISTTLQAKVYFGKEEITYNFLPVSYKWTRISNDIFADERWNLSAERNYEIDITDKDVLGGRTTFNCELLDEEGNRIISVF